MATTDNRKLLDFLANQMATDNTENFCDVNESSFVEMFENVIECKYLETPNVELPFVREQRSTLILLYVNIRSLNKNFDELHCFLTSLSHPPDIVCASETRLKGEPLSNITTTDYNFAQIDSVTNAGGVAIYISSKYMFELVQSYNMNLNGCEDLWLEVTVPTNQTSFIIGAVYCHPSSKIETFCEAFINTINLLSKKIFYVLGDVNIDISANARTPSATHYI